MRRLLSGWIVLAVAAPGAASTLYVCPDVPTDETASVTTLLPWEVSKHETAPPGYAPVLAIPGRPRLDAIHKMDRAGDWLLSLETASDLGGALPSLAEGRDVLRYDAAAASYAPFFCGGSVAGAVPPEANVDAVLLDGGDGGDLWVSFDVPTEIGAFDFDPADLVAYTRTGPGCSGWALAASNPAFDASAAGTGIPVSANVIGAEKIGGTLLLTLDVPTDLGPPGLVTYTTAQVLSWNGALWSIWQPLAGWPLASAADGLSGVGNPGRVALLHVAKSLAVPGGLDLSWSAACSGGATDYGIYEGILGTWYSHVAIACTDAGADRAETVTPGPGNRYFLVVPRNAEAEGSYGLRSGPLERPVGAPACAGIQVVTSCP